MSDPPLRMADFDYALPAELIAQTPAEPRDAARLLVLPSGGGAPSHAIFRDVGAHLRAGDLLVLNRTRVLPARLVGRRTDGAGGRAELLLLRRDDNGVWEALVRPARRLRPGTALTFGDDRLQATVLARTDAGTALLGFRPEPIEPLLAAVGQMPLPPYIRAWRGDPERYQTVYAAEPGSAAAPTAGLHFTPELLDALAPQGISTAHLTLHVGLDTFRPIHVPDPRDHPMHREYCELSAATADAIARTRAAGGRVIAVGTTSVRTLETAALAAERHAAAERDDSDLAGPPPPDWLPPTNASRGLPLSLGAGRGERFSRSIDDRATTRAPAWIAPYAGWTDLFITPGYRFQALDGLITNFHLPRSTLLLLVSALIGRERLLGAYAEAIRQRYRFYSFGDAMLIL